MSHLPAYRKVTFAAMRQLMFDCMYGQSNAPDRVSEPFHAEQAVIILRRYAMSSSTEHRVAIIYSSERSSIFNTLDDPQIGDACTRKSEPSRRPVLQGLRGHTVAVLGADLCADAFRTLRHARIA